MELGEFTPGFEEDQNLTELFGTTPDIPVVDATEEGVLDSAVEEEPCEPYYRFICNWHTPNMQSDTRWPLYDDTPWHRH